MKKKDYIQIVFVLFLAFISFSFLTNSNEKLIKNFTLKSVDNKKVSLNDYKDAKGFAVVFICNKCPMAKLYSDRLNKINNKYKNQKVYLLAINSMDTLAYAEESFKLMQKKATKDKFNFPYLQDKKQVVAKQFNATHTPQAFIIWKNKTSNKFSIKYQGTIDDNAAEPEKSTNHYLINAIDDLLKNKEVETPKSDSFGCRIFFRGEKQNMY
ncbi:MAG: thioredoxin family protein [Flavobacterium sp.]|uniref:thioredoxin family protein n=1 Tax=Flavobacterium sp. TaxID=239 RepID=UPI003BC11D6E